MRDKSSRAGESLHKDYTNYSNGLSGASPLGDSLSGILAFRWLRRFQIRQKFVGRCDQLIELHLQVISLEFQNQELQSHEFQSAG
jgi:hypothetical protein